MKPYQFTRPPRPLRNNAVRSDNLALVPGSILPFKAQWQAIANNLPKGNILIVLPPTNRPQRKVFEKVASLLEADGQRVITISAEQFH